MDGNVSGAIRSDRLRPWNSQCGVRPAPILEIGVDLAPRIPIDGPFHPAICAAQQPWWWWTWSCFASSCIGAPLLHKPGSPIAGEWMASYHRGPSPLAPRRSRSKGLCTLPCRGRAVTCTPLGAPASSLRGRGRLHGQMVTVEFSRARVCRHWSHLTFLNWIWGCRDNPNRTSGAGSSVE